MGCMHAKTTSVFVVFLILTAAFPLKYDHEGICLRPHTFYWPGLELLTYFTGWNIRIFGCFSSSVNCWTESPICIRNNATLLAGVEVYCFTLHGTVISLMVLFTPICSMALLVLHSSDVHGSATTFHPSSWEF